MAKIILDRLIQQFTEGEILETGSQLGNEWARVAPAHWFKVAQFLRDDAATAMNMLIDVTAVDRVARVPRFDVVVHLYSTDKKHRVRLLAGLPEDNPEVASLCALWPAANWFERETYDMYGVRFADHPDLRRILMYTEFQGHPLRKDYVKDKRQPLLRRKPGSDELDPSNLNLPGGGR
jgi:NADH-quinone oxidoreductase subunit C